jgi:glycosyltransferase involved in cell wall biosynthesis
LCPELYEVKFGKRGLFWRFLFLTERLTFAAADVSIATNESYRKIAINRGGMRPEDVFVVRSGPKLDKLETRSPKPALKKGAEFLVGYVGVIGQQEGLDLLVEAVDILNRRYAPLKIHVAVVGDGPALQGVKKLAREKGLDACFTFTGRASDDLLLDILNTADVCVNSDRWSEMNDKSTMNKIMEYMALGKPIVQFDLHEGRQSASEASLYARPDDPEDFAQKIADLIEHPENRRRMGDIGRKRIVDNLSWEHSIPPLLAAYARVFEKDASRIRKERPATARLGAAGAKAPR